MKEQALAIIREVANPNDKMNLLREYLQAFALRSLHESEAFTGLSFVGGTALRFLHNLPRFSEDLDFSLEDKTHYQLEKWLEKLGRDLHFAKFDASVSLNARTAVHNAWIKIPGLLKEAGLSGRAEQKISIKIEIDTNPPAGARLETRVINKYFLIAIQYHDLPSLMAGKIHALCTRKYLKGRDFYDLLWYRSHRPPLQPNLKLLQAALDQTESRPWQAGDWKGHLLKKLASIDWKRLVADAEPLLERPEEKRLLKRGLLEKAIVQDAFS